MARKSIGCKVKSINGTHCCGKPSSHYAVTHSQSEGGESSATLAVCPFHAKQIHDRLYGDRPMQRQAYRISLGNLKISAVSLFYRGKEAPMTAKDLNDKVRALVNEYEETRPGSSDAMGIAVFFIAIDDNKVACSCNTDSPAVIAEMIASLYEMIPTAPTSPGGN